MLLEASLIKLIEKHTHTPVLPNCFLLLFLHLGPSVPPTISPEKSSFLIYVTSAEPLVPLILAFPTISDDADWSLCLQTG